MLKSYTILFICFISFIVQPLSYSADEGDKKPRRKILINDDYRYMAINQIKMWFSNNGSGSHDPTVDGCGFLWPGGENATQPAGFADGLIFGGKCSGEIRVNGNTFRNGLQAGKILPNGLPDNPNDPRYRIYKILRGWESLPPGPVRDQYQTDYNEWPIEDGAPYVDVNGNGTADPGIDLPAYIGNETAWFVSNDLDPARSMFTYGTMPMGLEIQTTVFAYNTLQTQDMIFKRYLIINKSNSGIDSMFLGYWADLDLQDNLANYIGCDSVLNMYYVYMKPLLPGAVGIDLLQGPIVPGINTDTAKFLGEYRPGFKNLPMTSFVIHLDGVPFYRMPTLGTQAGALEFYNNMNGLNWAGLPIKDPNNQLNVKKTLAGDPITGVGWYEGSGWPGGPNPWERRGFMSSGPFSFLPGDTQEVYIGYVLASDNSWYPASVQALKIKDVLMQEVFNNISITAVEDEPQILESYLSQNFPNPFNPSTTIKYSLSKNSNVDITIFDLLGNEVEKVLEEDKPAGTYEIIWNAAKLPTGVYFYRIKTNNFVETRKMMLLK